MALKKLSSQDMEDPTWVDDIYDERKKDNRKDAVKLNKGEVYKSKSYGDAEILGFVTRHNQELVVIKFENTGNTRLIRPNELTRGEFADTSYLTKVKGRIVMTNTCGECEILTNPDTSKASRTYRVDVRFKDSGGIVEQVILQHLLAGRCKDPWRKVCCGVGYVGRGKHNSMENGRKKSLVYSYWSDMLKRCYSKKFDKSSYRDFGILVDEHWHNFQNFAEWYEEYPYKGRGWQLDKDFILLGNKVYSPDTCSLLPREVNGFFNFDHRKKGYLRQGVNQQSRKSFLVSVGQGSSTQSQIYRGYPTAEEAFYKYKEEKEKKANQLADEWEGVIDPRVIHTLRNFDIQPQFPD